MNTNKPMKLSRAQIRESLDTVPIDSLFVPAVSKELTTKQKRFALEVAKGSTGADAYRKTYSPNQKPKTIGDNASRLKADSRIQAEIEALKRAIAAQEYQTPAALRALVIQSLVGVITNPDSQPGQITAAAKVLGTVTEVAAFTERKEVRTITSSEDARAKVMSQLKEMMRAEAVDAEVLDRDADSLLSELAAADSAVGAGAGADGGADADQDATHPYPTPRIHEAEPPASNHTIPLE